MPTSAAHHVACDHVARLADIPPLLARVVREEVEVSERQPAPRTIEVESSFDAMEAPSMENLDSIGARAGLTCPECHGPLWKIADPTLARFRCLVGHGYTARALAEAQAESQEQYLWQALRLMNERASAMFEMVARAADRHSEPERLAYEAQLRRLQRNMSTIEAMLEGNGTWST
jgi:two-component system chemotaxis response regulator CheB